MKEAKKIKRGTRVVLLVAITEHPIGSTGTVHELTPHWTIPAAFVRFDSNKKSVGYCHLANLAIVA